MASIGLGALATVGINMYALGLIVLRGRLFKTRVYRPMIVNIGLSLVPVVVALGLVVVTLLAAAGIDRLSLAGGSELIWTLMLVGTGFWVLFFPNSMYLITELNLSHRRPEDKVPLWYDIVQTLTLTLSGIANAIVSLAVLQLFSILVLSDPNTDQARVPTASWLFALAVITLGSLGVYLGRYLRFNSWDVRHPSSMIAKTRTYYSARGRVADTVGFVATHTLLIAVLYVPLFALVYEVLLGQG